MNYADIKRIENETRDEKAMEVKKMFLNWEEERMEFNTSISLTELCREIVDCVEGGGNEA